LLPSEQAKELYKDLTLNKPLFGRIPPQLIYTPSSHFTGMQYLKKRGKAINLPILWRSCEAHIPLV
jgi:hypothetical protein